MALTWDDLDLLVDGDPLELRDRAWAEIQHLRSEVKRLDDHRLALLDANASLVEAALPRETGAVVPEVTYLDLVRELGQLTMKDCCGGSALHRRDAAAHLNALLSNPRLIRSLARIADNL